MYLLTNLEEEVFAVPYAKGYRRIRILAGYASVSFLWHILEHYEDIEIDLFIGMASVDGVSIWQHEQYKRIAQQQQPRVNIYYQMTRPGVHTKIYHWNSHALNDDLIFIGSANFSWNGFRRQNELLVEATYSNSDEVFGLTTPISCLDPMVQNFISLYNMRISDKQGHELKLTTNQQVHETTVVQHQSLEYVDLSLLTRNGIVAERSGLNWGKRDGRNQNQAYIPVSQSIHRNYPRFFPPRGEHFIMLTDDQTQLLCVMAQDNSKAIHTYESNSIMGSYFRNRLGVPNGELVTQFHLQNYGRDFVRIYKIDLETYYLDFSVELNLGNCEERLPFDRGSEILLEDDHLQVQGETVFIRVPELNIDIYGGWLCSWNEDEEDFMADSDLVIIKRLGANEILYDESGSSLIVAVSNYCTSAGFCNDIGYLENLGCEIIK